MTAFILLNFIGFLSLSSIVADIDPEESEPDIFSRIFHEQHKDPGPQAVSRAAVQTKWIRQKLDHFDSTETRTWKMRYMVNKEFYEQGGPIFIHVGGEWVITPGYISSGLVYDMAKELKGYLFYTEHRYYGKSKPVRDLSNKNMRFLNVRQALADLANFIRTMKLTIPGLKQSKVILTGGSYSGAMVTWFKKLYPDLVIGCWASSAPLLAKADFLEYKEVTGQSIRLLGGDECYNRIHSGIMELEGMLITKCSQDVKEMFNLCESFDETNELDVWTLFSSFSNIFAGVVQNHSNDTIQQACQIIMSGSNDVDGLQNYFGQFFSSKKCNQMTYKTLLKSMNYTTFGTQMQRQWTYQTCNEFGWIQSSTSVNQPFGTKFPVKLYNSVCYDVFGETFTEDYLQAKVNETNAIFGGLQPQVENVYFTHGQLDPWRAAGITEEGKATVIPLTSHCTDFGSISEKDNAELKASKETLLKLITEWLK